MEDPRTKTRHNLNIQARSLLTATGVSKIRFFSDDTVAAESSCGLLVVKGEGLYVESLDSAEGLLTVKGKINSVSYGEYKDGKSFLKRLLK